MGKIFKTILALTTIITFTVVLLLAGFTIWTFQQYSLATENQVIGVIDFDQESKVVSLTKWKRPTSLVTLLGGSDDPTGVPFELPIDNSGSETELGIEVELKLEVVALQHGEAMYKIISIQVDGEEQTINEQSSFFEFAQLNKDKLKNMIKYSQIKIIKIAFNQAESTTWQVVWEENQFVASIKD